jgi:CheY-like chemotaxis protein
VTRFALEGEGFRVETAEDGKEALALLGASERPDLVLLDLMMPGMNGWQFLAEIARKPSLKAIPVVVFTAAARVEVPPGAAAFARKPIDLRSLIELIVRLSRDVDEALD